MKDISKCTGIVPIKDSKITSLTFCPLRHTCRRYNSSNSKYQSYIEAPYNVETKECELELK